VVSEEATILPEFSTRHEVRCLQRTVSLFSDKSGVMRNVDLDDLLSEGPAATRQFPRDDLEFGEQMWSLYAMEWTSEWPVSGVYSFLDAAGGHGESINGEELNRKGYDPNTTYAMSADRLYSVLFDNCTVPWLLKGEGLVLTSMLATEDFPSRFRLLLFWQIIMMRLGGSAAGHLDTVDVASFPVPIDLSSFCDQDCNTDPLECHVRERDAMIVANAAWNKVIAEVAAKRRQHLGPHGYNPLHCAVHGAFAKSLVEIMKCFRLPVGANVEPGYDEERMMAEFTNSTGGMGLT